MKIFLIALVLCCQLVVAAANVPLMPVRDLRPGMQGIGKTVISGDTIETFNVEILGVSGNEASGYSIFVRLYGDLIEKTGGVAQGMSGSPVYVDGRLVGAVAFGKIFNDPHYCFLTPIGSMLRLLDEPVSRPSSWIPQGTALQAGGFTSEGLAYLQEKLAPLGLDAVGGGGVGSAPTEKLEPGSAVGAAIMQGDLTLGALGTVTWTDNDGQVLAFGHPFMQRGDSNFFMNKVWVLGCIPNLQSSYKVGNIGEAIGSFTQDRASGIGGKTGKLPGVIPVHVAVSDSSRGLANNLRVQVIEDEKLVPTLVDAAVVNAVSKTLDRAGGGSARVRFSITGVDSKKKPLVIERENMYYSPDGIMKSINQELIEATNILMANKFEPVDIYGISVEAQLSEDVQVAEIVSATMKKSEAAPGEAVPVDVVLKPYRGAEFTKTVKFVVPKNHPGGKLNLGVRGGSSMAWVMNLLRKQQQEGMPAQKKDDRKTLADFVKGVNNADKNNEIIIDVAMAMGQPDPNMAQQDAGFAGMLQGSPFKQKYPFDFIVDGEVNVSLTVKK